MMEKQYWLMKSEPVTYGIEHLKKDKKTAWTGVRNFQARNYMREMKRGDEILFYHSNCKEPGVYGIAKVVSAPYPDPTQFDSTSDYFDARATKDKQIWDLVDIAFVKTLAHPVSITQLREDTATNTMDMLRTGSRLSVTSVTKREYERVCELAK